MLESIKRQLFGKWMEWEEFRARMEFRDQFYFQQDVRKENIRR